MELFFNNFSYHFYRSCMSQNAIFLQINIFFYKNTPSHNYLLYSIANYTLLWRHQLMVECLWILKSYYINVLLLILLFLSFEVLSNHVDHCCFFCVHLIGFYRFICVSYFFYILIKCYSRFLNLSKFPIKNYIIQK